jgi:TRAP-type C4-dicarboxylate transport system substrate-binding protein
MISTKRYSVSLIVLLSSIFLLGSAVKFAEAKEITLRYAVGWSQNAYEATHTTLPWVKAVEKATNNRVKIDVYWGDTLCRGLDAWETVKSGMADIAFAMMGFWPKMVPLADVFSLPGIVFDSAEQAAIIAWKLLEQYPSLRDQFNPLKVLAISPSGGYQFLTSKKQIRTIEDVKGMKLRITGGPPTEYIKSLGGVPVAIGMGEVYTNLQKGIIDGMAVAMGTIPGFNLHEVTDYLTHITLFHYYATRVMNGKTWKSLPADLQDAIMSVSGLDASRKWGKTAFDDAAEAAREAWKKSGHNLIEYTPSSNELIRWKEAAKPFKEKWVKDMQSAGYQEAPDILKTLQDMIKTVKPQD